MCQYIANSPASIKGVAVVPMGTAISDVDVGTLDFTSGHRTPRKGQVVILENNHGFFAALRIVDIKDDTRADAKDELTFDYWILRNGGRDFTEFDAV